MHRRIIPDIVAGIKICHVPGRSTAYEVARLMEEHNVGALAVTEGEGRIIGIVTERDLARRVIGGKLDPERTPVSEIMSADPDTLSPDDSAMKAMEMMQDKHYRHMPVVDDSGRFVAMVSIRDLYEVYA